MKKSIGLIAPGLLVALVVGTAAAELGALVPLIGAPVFAIVLGALVRNVVGLTPNSAPGIAFASKRILQWSIVLLGAGMSLSQVAAEGRQSLVIMTTTFAASFLTAWLVGRLLGVSRKMTVLIGAGTAICGGSAIAAVSPIIEANDHEIAYSMSTIFMFNVVAVLIFPLIGRLLGFTDAAFGMWAGTAINDTSSVVAAGYAYSPSAGNFATIVKLTRTTLIIPTALALAGFMIARRSRRTEPADGAQAPRSRGAASMLRIVPWFILGFLAMSLVNTLHLLSPAATGAVVGTGRFLIAVALGAVGMNADFRRIASAGARPLLVGLSAWFVVALTALVMQRVVGIG